MKLWSTKMMVEYLDPDNEDNYDDENLSRVGRNFGKIMVSFLIGYKKDFVKRMTMNNYVWFDDNGNKYTGDKVPLDVLNTLYENKRKSGCLSQGETLFRQHVPVSCNNTLNFDFVGNTNNDDD
jgi:hypothetical protein